MRSCPHPRAEDGLEHRKRDGLLIESHYRASTAFPVLPSSDLLLQVYNYCTSEAAMVVTRAS